MARKIGTAKEVVDQLKKRGTKAKVEAMARYAIPSENALGVSVGELKQMAKEIGKDHELALELWKSGVYEARMLAAFVDEPERVTAKQMSEWIKDFDSWAICDHCCFHLFDKTPHAWKKIPSLARSKAEFSRRCAFALLWSLSLHDKGAEDDKFLNCFDLIRSCAGDERNFVKKAVNMAIGALGQRNRALNRAAIELSQELSKSADKTSQWIGRNCLKELKSAKIQNRLKK